MKIVSASFGSTAVGGGKKISEEEYRAKVLQSLKEMKEGIDKIAEALKAPPPAPAKPSPEKELYDAYGASEFQVIVANGVANGTFMVAINRIGVEDPLTFYGSSFISDPYGRVLVQAPRDQPAVLVADLDLDQRSDWLELFPFLRTRRPDAYGSLTRSR